MKTTDQIKSIKSNFAVTHHKFLNMLKSGLERKLNDSIQLRMTNKSIQGNKITTIITGEKTSENSNEHLKLDEMVRKTMAEIKNPVNLIALLK